MNLNFRIDFRIVNIADDQRPAHFICTLDPDRYEYTDHNGRRGWIDKLDHRKLFLSEAAVIKALARAGDLAITNDAPLITDAADYIASRKEAIASGLVDGVTDASRRNITNEELGALVGTQRHFVIASIDIAGSTRLSQSIEPRAWTNVLQVFSREVAKLCYLFHGRPLQFVGDGAILYFPVGSVLRKHDFASDCALTLQDLILVGINPELRALGLPEIACRIGVDSGDAYVATIGDAGTTNRVDIVGHVVGLATKIEKLAKPNQICFGEAAVCNMHTFWLRHTSRVTTPEDWPFIDKATGQPYGVFLLDIP